MATRRRLGTGPAPTTQAVPGQVPRQLAAERATDPRNGQDGTDQPALAEAWTAAGRRRLGLGGAHHDG
ncbi:hypothetical protein OG216_47800 (plasmid) [Streptomycetaceae bacterium NBC_01309]